MKKLLIFCWFFLIFINFSFTQNTNLYRAFAYKTSWVQEEDQCNVLISVDLINSTIKIYVTESPQIMHILKSEKIESSILFYCLFDNEEYQVVFSRGQEIENVNQAVFGIYGKNDSIHYFCNILEK